MSTTTLEIDRVAVSLGDRCELYLSRPRPEDADAIVRDLARVLAGGEWRLSFAGTRSPPQAPPATAPPSSPSTIRAKFPGKCRECRQPFAAGDPITWERGAGAAHEECSPP